MKKSLLFLMVMLAGLSAWAEVVTIGSGDATGTMPTNTYNSYSVSEQLYTAAEIGTAGEIKSISLFCTEQGNYNARTYDIYLGHTTNTDLYMNWLQPGNLVFSGGKRFAVNEWTTFTFDTPFEYNGTDNLVIRFVDRKGSYWTRDQFLIFEAPQQARLRSGDNSSILTNETPWISQVWGSKNQIKIEIENSGVTGIVDLDATQSKSGQRFNLMGQPVGKDYKGIVIEDGKKLIVR